MAEFVRTWKYPVKLLKVVDGDTIDLNVDQDFSDYKHARFRLYGINTPELRRPTKVAGLAAKVALQTWLDEFPDDLHIQTYKDKTGKYGRYLAEIFANGVNLNTRLVEQGFAVVEFYGRKKNR